MQGGLGMELALRHKPDLILLDLHLPDIPGARLFERLRANPVTRDIPVVVVSADATERQVKRLLDAGAVDYLTKPLDLRRFLDVVRRYTKPVAESSTTT
jgi:CheY-like chemotaxis protein